ncbi:MAG TPA: hypothetical protein VHH14_06605 [Solirubrobacterales bacterium]|nr:hypothetical protein [Solirubrobacterales bacterium]
MLAALSLAVLVAGQGAGQSKPAGKKGKAGSGRVREAEEAAMAVGGDLRVVGRALVMHSISENAMLAVVDLRPSYERRGHAMHLSARLRSPGKELVRPEAVKLIVNSFSDLPTARSLRGPVVVEADGERFALREQAKSEIFYVRRRNSYHTTLEGSLAFSTYERVVNSADVKVHVGPRVLELGYGDREALRDLLRALEPSPGKP